VASKNPQFAHNVEGQRRSIAVVENQLRGGRRGDGRGWLGSMPNGAERLARIFQVGRAPSREGPGASSDLGQELAQLSARVSALEQTHQPAATDPEPTVAAPRPPAALSAPIELPHIPLTDDRDHWLSRCDQFAVYAGERHLGTVDGIRYASRADRPDLIEVRGGPFGRRLLVLPVDEIEAVIPDEQAVIVSEACSGTTARERLRTRLKQVLATLRPLPR
jgi:hypothetical protein